MIVRIDVRHVRPARGRRGRRRGSGVELDRPLPANAGAIAYMRGSWPRAFLVLSGIERSAFAGARARRAEAQAVAGACRPASSLLRAPRGGVVASSNYEYEERKTNRCVHGTPAGALTGARPVKPAVGWYMPVGFRSGQNRATCGSWGTVRGPCADPSWSSVEQLFMRHGSISPLPSRPPFFPHYCQLDVTLATPPCW